MILISSLLGCRRCLKSDCIKKHIHLRILVLVSASIVSGFVTAQDSTESSQVLSQSLINKRNIQKSVKSTGVVRVFVLAGQSNMQGHGKIYDGATGAMGAVITSFTPTCNGTGTCDFTLNMVDTYGDGWNGWTYDIVQAGVVVATETLPNGSAGTATITLQSGVPCDVVVNQAGSYGGEISWTLTDLGANVVASMNGQQENYPSPNTLLDVMENDTEGQWTMLQTGGAWTVLDDAYLHFENGDGTVIKDNVTIGQGVNPNYIGPELMFAHQMDQYFEDPVLIIKAAWGGLSLAEDFRPPSAGGTTGPYYIQMLDIVESATVNLATEFPEIDATDFEISGFAWFQGWNDAASEAFLNEYESNLYHLVNDVRTDFGNPALPVVIASAGQGGYEPSGDGWMQAIQDIVAVAQENVGCNDSLYGGTVGFVDSKAFYMIAAESPDDAGYHYNNNALTMLKVGRSMGDQMVLAINDLAYCEGFVSVPEESSESYITYLYPNPAINTLNVEMFASDGETTTIRLYDAKGRIVFERHQLNSKTVIDVSTFAKGLYVLECIRQKQTSRHRVVLD
jgi:hypothetical protein